MRLEISHTVPFLVLFLVQAHISSNQLLPADEDPKDVLAEHAAKAALEVLEPDERINFDILQSLARGIIEALEETLWDHEFWLIADEDILRVFPFSVYGRFVFEPRHYLREAFVMLPKHIRVSDYYPCEKDMTEALGPKPWFGQVQYKI